ncbi:copper resistance CopC/CopD family protein [Candidatus Nitrosacidococcus tergens]|uniref:Copper resistance protein C n=1 Tax=Candidatus Nitrosacidococcus tergens TaxID=553981 RepID=A0A7G1Q8T3_9GAMM|nr:CopD family protein [Candidatus Nitrosacidococcus tergens]CAB1275235.1 conserved membrane protein of unknown function [Candidatus Nitrosacidococcus tergens]
MRNLLFIFTSCLFFWGQTVWGHAALVSTLPESGAILDASPKTVTLIFNEPVGITKMQLIDPKERQINLDSYTNRNEQIHISIPDMDLKGTYLLSWRIVSADGHPVGGILDYSIGTPSVMVTDPSANISIRNVAIWLSKWLGYLCLFVVSGAILFRVLAPKTKLSWVFPFALLGIITLPIDLGLQGLDLQDSSWATLADSTTWVTAFSTGHYAWMLGLMAVVFLVGLSTLNFHKFSMIIAIIGGGISGLAFSVSGHASTAPPQWLARPLVTLHIITAIFWVGLFIPLVRLLPSYRNPFPTLIGLTPLASFSRWITPVVIVLVISGLGLSYLQVDRLDSLWRTEYGEILIAKLILVALLLILASLNRWCYTEPALSGSTKAQKHLKYSISLEIILAILVLGVVSLWRFTPPPRSLNTSSATKTIVFHLQNSQIHAEIKEQRDSLGTWEIAIATHNGQIFSAQEVTLIITNPFTPEIEPLRRQAHQVGDLWLAHLPVLPITEYWKVQLKILIDDFDQVILKN